MNENVDNQLEIMVKKAVKQSALEMPSFDFTTNLMLKIDTIKHSASTTYQPLISKQMWFLIFTGFVAFVAYITFITKPEASQWYSTIDRIDTGKIYSLFNMLQPSGTVMYAIAFLAIMLLIQIPLLKNYFDKRFVV